MFLKLLDEEDTTYLRTQLTNKKLLMDIDINMMMYVDVSMMI